MKLQITVISPSLRWRIWRRKFVTVSRPDNRMGADDTGTITSKPMIMNELRSFLIAATGTLGLLEVTNSEQLLPTESDPETMAIKAIITLVAGLLSTFLTRLFRKAKGDPAPKARLTNPQKRSRVKQNKTKQTLKKQ